MKLRFCSVLVLCLLLGACNEAVVHSLSETEANRIVTILDGRNISGKKVRQPDGKWAIEVPVGDVSIALWLLERGKLMRNQHQNNIEAISAVSSREAQRFHFERALSSELETTLDNIRGVLFSRVHLNPAKTDPVFGNPLRNEKSSASVFMLVSQSFVLSENNVASLVGGASGVEPGNISVLITKDDAVERNERPSHVQESSLDVEDTSPLARIWRMPCLSEKGRCFEWAAVFCLFLSGIFIFRRAVSRHRNLKSQ